MSFGSPACSGTGHFLLFPLLTSPFPVSLQSRSLRAQPWSSRMDKPHVRAPWGISRVHPQEEILGGSLNPQIVIPAGEKWEGGKWLQSLPTPLLEQVPTPAAGALPLCILPTAPELGLGGADAPRPMLGEC